MSVFDQTAMNRRLGRTPSMGPPIGPGESFAAAFRAARLADSTVSRELALEEAYARRIEAIEAFSGTRLDNPASPESAVSAEPGRLAVERPTPARRIERREQRIAEFQAAARALEVIPPSAEEMQAEAFGISREAAEDANAAFERGSGLAAFAGSMVGIGLDPPVLASMLLGAPAATSILRGMLIEAAAAGGTEAAIQPAIQEFRREAGLPSGLREAAINVAAATAGGGVFAGLLRGSARSLKFLRDRAAKVEARTQAEVQAQIFVSRMVDLEERAPFHDLPKGRAEHRERMSAAQQRLRDPERATIPEEPTVAIREDQRQTTLKPEDAGLEDAPNAVREAFEAGQILRARMLEELGGVERLRAAKGVAEDLLGREGDIKKAIAELRRPPRAPKATRLSQFLKQAGGLREFQGELKAIGARKRPGLINNKAGLALDEAALRAQEAGFFPDKPLASGHEVEVRELLEALDDDISGRRPVISLDDAEAQIEARAATDLFEEVGRTLEEMGIDAAKMDGETIRARLDRVAQVPDPAETPGAGASEAAGLARAAEGFEDNAEVMDAALEREVRAIYDPESAAVDAAERAAIEAEGLGGALDDAVYITEGDEIRRVTARDVFEELDEDERFLAELEDCFTGGG